MILKFRHFTFYFLVALLVLFSCGTTPAETPNAEHPENDERQAAGGIADEIRSLVETGRLSSMIEALELIENRALGGADFGRMMNGIITVLIRTVYPDSPVRLPSLDLPLTFQYTRIIREAERGIYTHPNEDSTDFFEYILPFLAVNNESNPDILTAALNDLQKAAEMRPQSVLPPYFQGLIYEQVRRFTEAEAAYRRAYVISSEFYPALVGSARIMVLSGRRDEANALYSDLVIRYPDSMNIKRQFAISLYESGNWSRAGPVVDEILQNNPRDRDFLLMRARIMIEQGNFSQANAALDIYANISSTNRTYLFLRARLQAEGNRNRDSALNYLRSIIRSSPNDEEALIYAASLLMESQRSADQADGRELLVRLRQTAGSSIEVLSLSLRDAVQRESWQEAQGYLNRVLAVRRTVQDLVDGYYVERGLENNIRALSFARELYDRDSANNDYTAIFISALIDNGRREEASRMLESGLTSVSDGPNRSALYFLRSRIQNTEEAALGDLRSSLFEDPRNLDALIAMFEIYHRRREERRAVHYLRQALAIAPDNPRLRQFEREYASLLSTR